MHSYNNQWSTQKNLKGGGLNFVIVFTLSKIMANLFLLHEKILNFIIIYRIVEEKSSAI